MPTILEQVDQATKEADTELRNLSGEAITIVANWWQKWYLRTGHKRLARLLLQYIKGVK